MLDDARWRIEIMGTYGFSAKYIQRMVKRYDGEDYSLSTIYVTLHKAGIRMRDYRDGETTEAKTQMARLGATNQKVRRAS